MVENNKRLLLQALIISNQTLLDVIQVAVIDIMIVEAAIEDMVEAEVEEDIVEEAMMIERDLECVHEAEVQEAIKIVLQVMVVVIEIDQEIVWVVAAEEIDIRPLLSFT